MWKYFSIDLELDATNKYMGKWSRRHHCELRVKTKHNKFGWLFGRIYTHIARTVGYIRICRLISYYSLFFCNLWQTTCGAICSGITTSDQHIETNCSTFWYYRYLSLLYFMECIVDSGWNSIVNKKNLQWYLRSTSSCENQGPISLTISPSQFKFDGKFI